MPELMTRPASLSYTERHHQAIERLRTETPQVEAMIEQLNGVAANLRQLVLEDKVHLDTDSAKALADLAGLYQAALVLCRLAHGLSEQLAAPGGGA